MKEMVSNLTSERKLFIGDFDSYSIIRYGIVPNQLNYLSTIGLLLFDRLMLPAAFFWQSPQMQKLLIKLQPAMNNGQVLPVIRDYETTTDIRDYFDRRMDESEKLGQIEVFNMPELASEIAKPESRIYVKLMEDIGTYAHLDQNSIRDIYIRKWTDDLENHTDINSLRLLIAQSSLSIIESPIVVNALLECTLNPQFSRASCIDTIQKLIPKGKCQDLMIERASWLYLKSNAEAYGCGMYYSYDPYNGMIYMDNLNLLGQTLGIFGLTKETIMQLSIYDILQIKSSTEYSRFICAYRDLISKICVEQNRLVSEIHKNISNEMKKEARLATYYNVFTILHNISGSIFLALVANHFSNSNISTPLLIGSGATTVVSTVIKRIDTVAKAMESQNFNDFKNYIITKQYVQSISSRTGVIF